MNENRGFIFVGALSLDAYLLHLHCVLHYIEKYHWGYWPTFRVCRASTLPAAWLLSKTAGWISRQISKIIKY